LRKINSTKYYPDLLSKFDSVFYFTTIQHVFIDVDCVCPVGFLPQLPFLKGYKNAIND